MYCAQLASETGREQHAPILASFALHHANLAVVQVHVLQLDPCQFGVPQPGEDQHLDQDHVLRIAGLPDRLVERDQLTIRKEMLDQFLVRISGLELGIGSAHGDLPASSVVAVRIAANR